MPVWAAAGVRDPGAVAREEAEAAAERQAIATEAARRASMTPDEVLAEQVAECLAALRRLPTTEWSSGRLAQRQWCYEWVVREADGEAEVERLRKVAPVAHETALVFWWRHAHRRGRFTLDDLRRDAGLSGPTQRLS
jgi:hypothetical protein